MESLTLQLEQQRARLLRSHSLESQNPSVYTTPYYYNNNIMDSPKSSSQYCASSTCPYDPSSPCPALYYVESPSTIVNLSSVGFHHNTDDDQNPNPSSLGYSLNDQPPLSRSASFLSRSWVSEPVSLMDVTARLHTWCKLQPSFQAKLISSSCKWDTVVLDEEMAGVEGWFNWGINRSSSRCPGRFKSLAVCMCVMVLLTTLLLGISTSVYWLFCHPKPPITTLKGVEFQKFHVGQGFDRSGVPTDMVSLQSIVQLAYYNPSQYYGTLVSPATVDFSYLPRPIGHGQVPDFQEDCSSQREVSIAVNSHDVPLYGAGPSLKQAIADHHHIPLGLTIDVKSQINLLGGIVRKYFLTTISCDVLFNPDTGSVAATYCEPPKLQDSFTISHLFRGKTTLKG